MGSGRCTGVTHFAVLLANYLAGVPGHKTALLEWNPHRDLARMEAVCMGKRSDRKEFRVLDVLYVKDAGMEELVSCMNRQYERIIIDFGDSFCKNRTEFLRCDRKIVLLSFCEWQMERCLEFAAEAAMEPKESWEFYAVFGSEESRMEVRKKLGLPVQKVPFSADAFTITREILKFMRHFDNV